MKRYTKKSAEDLRIYLRDNIEFYEEEIDLASEKAWVHHTGLELELPSSFVDTIWDKVAEWCEENEISYDDFFGEYDLEDVVFGD